MCILWFRRKFFSYFYFQLAHLNCFSVCPFRYLGDQTSGDCQVTWHYWPGAWQRYLPCGRFTHMVASTAVCADRNQRNLCQHCRYSCSNISHVSFSNAVMQTWWFRLTVFSCNEDYCLSWTASPSHWASLKGLWDEYSSDHSLQQNTMKTMV